MTAPRARCYDALVPLVNVFDYEDLARQRLSQSAFDYIAGGAEDEVTLRRNRDAFERIELRPRALVDVSNVELSTTVLGREIELPVLLAPVALSRFAHPDGEVGSARSAAEAGTIFALSTMASATIEQVAAASHGPKWFQLYVHPDRDVAKRLVQRAEGAGYLAICLTVDVPRLGRRERDLRNRLDFPPDVVYRNFIGEVDVKTASAQSGYSALAASADVLIDPSLTWDVIDWLRSFCSLPVLVKGIMTAEDARLAVDKGVAGIVVSNHGGRQLDGAPSTIDVLPEIVDAVDGRCEVLLDGGIRRGTDIVKALCMGAQAVLVGRAYAYGLGAGGGAGVARAIQILRADLIRTLKLLGCPSTAQLDESYVTYPADWRSPAPQPAAYATTK